MTTEELLVIMKLTLKWWREKEHWYVAARPGTDEEQLREALEAR